SGLSGGLGGLAGGGAGRFGAGRPIIGEGAQLAARLLEGSAQDVRFSGGGFRGPRAGRRPGGFAVGWAAPGPPERPAGLQRGRRAWSRGSIRRITAYRQLRPSPTAATSSRSRSIPIPAS